ncbi:MAG: hypothetical protein IT576_07495 [Verrucomicrobiales bacterium]|nr:hypothetical protein [Verrucomicrobiales bacterium]
MRFEIDGNLAGEQEIDCHIRGFHSDGSRVVIFDYFGPARLYRLRPFEFVGELIPADETSFVAAYIGHGDRLCISQTSASSPTQSEVLEASFNDQRILSSASIPCGGDMAFWKGGDEIGFRTLDSYSVIDGKLASKIGEWG